MDGIDDGLCQTDGEDPPRSLRTPMMMSKQHPKDHVAGPGSSTEVMMMILMLMMCGSR